MKVSFSDINHRINKIGSHTNSTINMRGAQIYTEKGIFCQDNAINSIKYWDSLDENIDIAFNKALDIFEELCINANEPVVKNSCDILLEGINRVRDATQFTNSFKNRFGRLKHKISTKILKAHNTVTDKFKSSINNLQNTFAGSGVASAKTVDVAQECYNALYDKCMLITECDRIVRNYAKISKRFNLDKIISNIRYENDLYQACFEIASCIDTYNQPFKSKYNCALETAAYVFDKHYMNYPKDKIIEAVTDYFLFVGNLKEDQINDIKSVINISVLFENSDFSSLSWLEPKTESISENLKISADDYGVDYDYLTEEDIMKAAKKKVKAFNKDVKKSTKKLIKDAKEGNPDEHRDDEVKEMINDFRSSCLKNKDSKSNLSSLKSLINKIFTKTPYQIVYELPNILSLIRVVFIIGSAAIHPVLAVCNLIADGIIKIHLSRKQMEKIVKAYNNEINSVKSKIDNAKDDKTKENLKKYLEALNKDLNKIKEYEDTIYTDEENDERHYADYDFDDDDDFDFGDDDFDFDDFEEVASIEYISTQMSIISEALIDDTVDGMVCNNIFKLDNDSIDSITDFSITVPVILEKDKLKECLSSYRNKLRESVLNTKDYIRIDCLNENILKLETANNSYSTANTIKDAMYYLSCLNEITKIKSNDYIIEMDFGNTIKLAINQLKKNAVKLSDKEKQISNSIDVAANNVAKNMEDAMMSGNREAVVRGSMIPSASKCIKIAISLGVAWAVSPAVAVISAIGGFACSKKLQAKERQLILDDIDIELKMCERYLRQAEDEGDMKKVKQIEIIQRNLERQKQRIKYKMATVYNKRVPEIKDNN